MTVLPLPWRKGRQAGPESLQPRDDGRPAEAVVFSGGGSLGAAQVGALRALYEAGVRPDVVVGCSVGALNAACLAVDPTLERVVELEGVWRSLQQGDVFPDNRVSVVTRFLRRAGHLYSPRALAELVERCVPVADLSRTAIPCHVVTTDLLAGEPRWWTSGRPTDVLLASACLPALFPPVELGGSLHVDGGVVCPVPLQRALDTGARRVWVLDVSSDFHGWSGAALSAMDVLLESFAISRAHLVRREPALRGDQRVVPMPSLGVGRLDLRDFSRTPELMRRGLEAGRRMVAGELAAIEVEPLSGRVPA